eukprot:5799826-Alexandrium_andersonii.AAC.2
MVRLGGTSSGASGIPKHGTSGTRAAVCRGEPSSLMAMYSVLVRMARIVASTAGTGASGGTGVASPAARSSS